MLTHFLFFILYGCPDPTTAADLGNPGPGGGPAGGPAPGEGAPQGPPPEPGSFDLEEGAGTKVSGQLTYGGSATGTVRIDVLKKEADLPPQLLHIEKPEALGPFSFQAPPNTGNVTLVAFIDVSSDGPSSDDPAGLVSIDIGETTVADIEISLSDNPDLGELTPGDAPPPPGSPSEAGPPPTPPETGAETVEEVEEASANAAELEPASAPADGTAVEPDATGSD
jgi:hypothetical protein